MITAYLFNLRSDLTIISAENSLGGESIFLRHATMNCTSDYLMGDYDSRVENENFLGEHI